MAVIRLISRLFVGFVFIYSGFVKIVDPLGSTYKFTDYFHDAFGMDWLIPLSFPMAVILPALEFVIGVALLLNIRIKLASWATLIFMGFFTTLTFYLAIADPVQDCGCFGDALILTNWQTFWKNVIIMVPTLIIFIYRKKYAPAYTKIMEWVIICFFLISSCWLSLYCYKHLPVIDFRPYNIGTYIPEKMVVPDDAPQPVFENIIVYKKDGQLKEFKIDNLPDSTWEWVETKNILISEGYEPPIHDFIIECTEDGDITDIVLDDDNYTFLLIAYDLNESSLKEQKKINELAAWCIDKEYNFLCLTSSIANDINSYIERSDAVYEFCNMDEITLKTIVRSNPGLVLLKDGTILGKWHYNDLPSVDEINDNILSYLLKTGTDKTETLIMICFIVVFLIIVRFIYNFRVSS